MIRIGNKVYRNIQEQVSKNKDDISALRNVETVLNEFGVTVLGRVDAETDIPEQEYTYGEAYLVGEEPPYDLYIYTRTDDPDVGEFINIGPVVAVGPQGPVGPQGDAGTIVISSVITGEPGTNASVVNVGTQQNAVLVITIPKGATGSQGIQGEQGPVGATGATGATGLQGPQGDPGESFMIVGVISSESQLPDPTTTPRNYAYSYNDGDSTTPDRLYYIIGTVGNESWTYSSLAAAGSTVLVSGNPVSSWNADNKLDKVSTTTTKPQLYSKSDQGYQFMVNMDNIALTGPVAGEIPVRGSGGQITVPQTPANPTDAASKDYVDNNKGITLDTLWAGSTNTSVDLSSLTHDLADYKLLMITCKVGTIYGTIVRSPRAKDGTTVKNDNTMHMIRAYINTPGIWEQVHFSLSIGSNNVIYINTYYGFSDDYTTKTDLSSDVTFSAKITAIYGVL